MGWVTACSGALPTDETPQARPTKKVPAAPVAAAVEGLSGDGVLALAPPGVERVRVNAGSFMMGSTSHEVMAAIQACAAEPMGDLELCERTGEYANELEAHEVYLSPYWIDRTEVTVARYRTCVSTGVCNELPYASGGTRFDEPTFPAVLMSYGDAKTFCQWAGGRLPTEAEWERAARGKHGRRFPWGNVYNAFLSNHGRLAWDDLDDADGFLELAPVGSFPDGASEDGALDLAGNVEEWVLDYYAPSYEEVSALNPRGPASGDEHVVRGGSYAHVASGVRAAARGHAMPDQRRSWRGFRCAYRSADAGSTF
ncbi:MAG: SUMF1/EgtB/PvdO family nonheme iron enzyme [Polyangiaceae bacterium]|nr:SUMF1/EgtB/PvdO family nonheme iron enzyme [Polyangiaceae bacterium]